MIRLRQELEILSPGLKRIKERGPVCFAITVKNQDMSWKSVTGYMIFHQISSSREEEGQLHSFRHTTKILFLIVMNLGLRAILQF